MKALLVLLIVAILWLPYCFLVVFKSKWETTMEGLLFGLIDWASI